MLDAQVFLVIFLVYPGVSAKVFATFACDKLDEPLYGSDSWLRVDHSISCNDSQRPIYYGYAWLMVFVYPLGVPALYAYLLFRKERRPLTAAKEEEEAADAQRRMSRCSTGESSMDGIAEVQAKHDAKLAYILPIIGSYSYRSYWFELGDAMRKLLLIGVPVFLVDDWVTQVLFGELVVFMSVMFFSCAPLPPRPAHPAPTRARRRRRCCVLTAAALTPRRHSSVPRGE